MNSLALLPETPSFPPSPFYVEMLEDVFPASFGQAKRIGYNFRELEADQKLDAMSGITTGEDVWDLLECHCLLIGEKALCLGDPVSQRAYIIAGGCLTRAVTLSANLTVGGSADATILGASSTISVFSHSTGKTWNSGAKLHATFHPKSQKWYAGAAPAIT